MAFVVKKSLIRAILLASITHNLFEALANLINVVPFCRKGSFHCAAMTSFTGRLSSIFVFTTTYADGNTSGFLNELYLLLQDLIIVIVLSDLPGSFTFCAKQIRVLSNYMQQPARKAEKN